MIDLKKITIAHIAYSYLPVTQNWIYNQIVQNIDCRAFVICQYCENVQQFPLESIYPVYPTQNLFTNICLLLSRFWIWYPKSFYRDILIRKKPDIIHGHFSHESWRVLSIARLLHIPLVTTFYGVDVNKLPKRAFWRKRYPLIFKYGSMFIVEGHHMKKELITLGCPEEKLRVVHLGVDIENIESLQKIKSDQQSYIKILYIGLEREKKGPIDAIKAFIKTANVYADAQLHIIGEGKYRNIVEKQSVENGVFDKVVFHGFVDVNEYLRLLAGCDIVLAPSCTAADGDTEGGAPVVLLEAQAAGKPVVSTYHCDIPEVVIDGVTGLLSPEHDIENLSANLIRLCKSNELREQFGVRGKEHIKRNHSIKKQVKVLSEIYHSICY